MTVAAAAIALSSGIAFRRRNPLLAAVVFIVPALDRRRRSTGSSPRQQQRRSSPSCCCSTPSAATRPDARPPAATGLLAGGMIAALTDRRRTRAGRLFWAALPVRPPRARRPCAAQPGELQAELREKAERAEREREHRARHAAEDERNRIADELQTLVANGRERDGRAGRRPFRARSTRAGPRQADAALAAVEDTGRDALSEMRSLLGVLRRDGDGLELAPQPGLGRVEALVERNRERGLGSSCGSRASRARSRPESTSRRTAWSRTRWTRPREGRGGRRGPAPLHADELRLQVT